LGNTLKEAKNITIYGCNLIIPLIVAQSIIIIIIIIIIKIFIQEAPLTTVVFREVLKIKLME